MIKGAWPEPSGPIVQMLREDPSSRTKAILPFALTGKAAWLAAGRTRMDSAPAPAVMIRANSSLRCLPSIAPDPIGSVAARAMVRHGHVCRA